MERTIRVTGRGRLSVKPDMIRLNITQTGVENTYESAIKESADKKNEITKSFEKLGFEKKELKTISFNINTEYESYQDKDKSWKQRLVGYRYNHYMKLEFPADNDTLGKILFAISQVAGEPEFSIEYTVADMEKAKNDLLSRAVEDSKAKAAVLTEAAGVKLGDLLTIDYSWSELEISSRPINAMMLRDSAPMCMSAKASIDIDIEADDIDVTDTVTVVWEIE